MKFCIVTILGVVLLAALAEATSPTRKVTPLTDFGKREVVMAPNEDIIFKRAGPTYDSGMDKREALPTLDEGFGRGKREAVVKRAGPPYDFGMGKRETVVKRAGPPYGFGMGKRETVVKRNGPTYKK